MEYQIDFIWDEEAAVWIATSKNISGLVLEYGSLDLLIERAKNAAQELLELNHLIPAPSIKCVCSRTFN